MTCTTGLLTSMPQRREPGVHSVFIFFLKFGAFVSGQATTLFVQDKET